MAYRRGDVINVLFPNSDLTSVKKRPALVVQADEPFPGSTQRIVACITSNMGRVGRTRIAVKKNTVAGREMGILSDSVIVVDNLATVRDQEVDKVIGKYPTMAKVDEALKVLFGLE